MPQSRQLAAIMFTDIVGYTTLMGEDEEKAFLLLSRNRLVQKPQIEKYGGKWIKELGDGVLATFSTVTDAVNCACSILKACEQEEGLQLRIGIHQAEVVFENNDVFGDGVNITSRLQSIAPVGGICISETVKNNIANHKEWQTNFLGRETLKHVKEPMMIYEVVVNGAIAVVTAQDQDGSFANKMVNDKSIAVLPFVNMSNDPDQEYFSDGMAEEILNSLSHLKNLKVAGRTSSFQFKDKNVDLREIGQKLNVRTVLEGSVRKQGNRLRITAQLVNVEDGFHLWSERYDREMDDIFAIQDEIALVITEKLKITLLQNDRARITKNVTQNIEAYELYLRGRYFLNKRFLIQSLEQFKEAIKLDHDFAKAHAGLADTYIILGTYNIFPSNDVMPKAKLAAEAALQIDPSMCEPYCSLGLYYAAYEWNWMEAKRNFLKAIDINPNYTQTYIWYGHYYLTWVEGKIEEGKSMIDVAISQEPLSALGYSSKFPNSFAAGDFDEAFDFAKKGVELDPDSYITQRIMGMAYMLTKNYDKAEASLLYARLISKGILMSLVDLIVLYVTQGSSDKALAIMVDIRALLKEEKYISPLLMSCALAELGQIEEAIPWLEKAYEEHDAALYVMKHYPWIPANLKENRRFQIIQEKMNFPV